LATNKSAMKRSRQADNSKRRNASAKSQVKTATKDVLNVLESGDKGASLQALAKAIPTLNKAAAKGVFHKKTISRKISRLTRKLNSLQ